MPRRGVSGGGGGGGDKLNPSASTTSSTQPPQWSLENFPSYRAHKNKTKTCHAFHNRESPTYTPPLLPSTRTNIPQALVSIDQHSHSCPYSPHHDHTHDTHLLVVRELHGHLRAHVSCRPGLSRHLVPLGEPPDSPPHDLGKPKVFARKQKKGSTGSSRPTRHTNRETRSREDDDEHTSVRCGRGRRRQVVATKDGMAREEGQVCIQQSPLY